MMLVLNLIRRLKTGCGNLWNGIEGIIDKLNRVISLSMFKKLQNLLSNFFSDKRKTRLLDNFFSLAVLQGANYILPLLTMPYLVRVLGVEQFGLLMFAQSFITYINILTDYGFNLSATKLIAVNRENEDKISEIFSGVFLIKLALLLFCFIIMLIAVFSFEKF